MTSRITISVPDLGDFRDVEVIDVLVAAGTEIAVESPLITLETDKAAMDVPATAAGRVVDVRVKKGDRVSQGDPILVLEPVESTAGATSRPKRAAKAAPEPVAASSPLPATPAASAIVEVRVPELGEFRDVEVIEVLAAPGDAVELESPLITLETEKATMDVP
ncbi:MAG: biotin/lipoyl-containing protein, partial [Steroidobacteraceae bacterium]